MATRQRHCGLSLRFLPAVRVRSPALGGFENYGLPVAPCAVEGLAVRATSWRPRFLMPRTIAGRALRVAERLPPPSWRITIDPGCTAERTRLVIFLAELP